jgi:hypothetical protein
MSYTVRGQGPASCVGWWTSPKAEELVQDWLDAADEDGQHRAAAALGALGMDGAPTIPRGQFTGWTAHRESITGLRPGPLPYPWDAGRA